MATAYSYVRFSSAEQSKGSSQSRQENLAKDFCQKHKLKLSEKSFNDFGISAYRGNNLETGALSEFIKLAESGKIEKGSYLVIEKLDRFSRAQIPLALGMFSRLLETGVKIATTEPERVYTAKDLEGFGVMEIIVHFLIANEESLKKSERLKNAWRQKREGNSPKNNGVYSRIRPAWIDPDGKLNPAKTKIIQKIFDLCIKGQGITKITRYLNENNVPTIGNTKRSKGNGKLWQCSYVTRILDFPATYGVGELGAKVDGKRKIVKTIPGFYPAAITEEKFFAARKAMADRKGKSGRPTRVRNHNLFSGLLWDMDNKCSFTMIAKRAKKLVSTNGHLGREGAPYVTFPYLPLEETILKHTKEICFAPSKPDSAPNPLEALEGKLNTTIAKLKAAQAKYESTDDDSQFDSLLETIQRLSQQKKEWETKIKEEKSKQKTDTRKEVACMIENIGQENRAELKQYLLGLIEKISISVKTVSRYDRIAFVHILFKDWGHKVIQINTTTGKYSAMAMETSHFAKEQLGLNYSADGASKKISA